MLLKFEAVSRPILLDQGMKLLAPLGRVFANWPWREVSPEGQREPQIAVTEEDGVPVLRAPWLAGPLRYADPVALADSLATQLVRAWARDRALAIWIDAAAVSFGEELVVLLGGRRGARGLIVAALAASGHRVFADGLLPVAAADRRGIGMGIAPRIELPLPDGLPWAQRAALLMQKDTGNGSFFHLNPGRERIACFGETAPIRAFVLLDESASGPTALRAARSGTILKRMLLHGGCEGISATQMLDRLHRLVAGAPCYRLAGGDADAARVTLRARFAMWRSGDVARAAMEPAGDPPDRRRSSGPRNPTGPCYRPSDGLSERQVEGDLFLVGGGGETIYHLNGLGAGLWRLLGEAHGLDDAVCVLRDAFPYVDHVVVEQDARALVADLTARGLLVERAG